jgi:hypothetical protein
MNARALTPAITAMLAALPAQDRTDGFRWQTDFAAARKTAAEQDKPLMLLFRCER